MSKVNPEGLEDRSTGELLKRLSNELTALVSQEIELAKAEVAEKGKKAGIGAGMFGAAGVVLILALGSLTATIIALLATIMSVWLASLIVTVIWTAVAGILAIRAKSAMQESTPVVPQTVETLKEDAQWTKDQMKSARR